MGHTIAKIPARDVTAHTQLRFYAPQSEEGTNHEVLTTDHVAADDAVILTVAGIGTLMLPGGFVVRVGAWPPDVELTKSLNAALEAVDNFVAGVQQDRAGEVGGLPVECPGCGELHDGSSGSEYCSDCTGG